MYWNVLLSLQQQILVGYAAWLVLEAKIWVIEDPIGNETWERRKRK